MNGGNGNTAGRTANASAKNLSGLDLLIIAGFCAVLLFGGCRLVDQTARTMAAFERWSNSDVPGATFSEAAISTTPITHNTQVRPDAANGAASGGEAREMFFLGREKMMTRMASVARPGTVPFTGITSASSEFQEVRP